MNRFTDIIIAAFMATAFITPAALGDHHESDPIAAAIAHPDRPEADKARDEGRKPGQVLAFFGVEPGMAVLETFGGGGYYSELLSRVAGPEGRVIVQNNDAIRQFEGDAIAVRFADDRLPNVKQYWAEANDIDVAENSMDLALNILNYHDIYYVPEEDSGVVWPTIDPEIFLGNLYRALKPGGILGIIDHAAAEDRGTESGNMEHRIAEEIVMTQVLAAGFELVASADFLRNPEDDLSMSVFDPAIRGYTDRFVLKFRKPLS